MDFRSEVGGRPSKSVAYGRGRSMLGQLLSFALVQERLRSQEGWSDDGTHERRTENNRRRKNPFGFLYCDLNLASLIWLEFRNSSLGFARPSKRDTLPSRFVTRNLMPIAKADMTYMLYGIFFAIASFVGMLLCFDAGRRVGIWQNKSPWSLRKHRRHRKRGLCTARTARGIHVFWRGYHIRDVPGTL